MLEFNLKNDTVVLVIIYLDSLRRPATHGVLPVVLYFILRDYCVKLIYIFLMLVAIFHLHFCFQIVVRN